MSNVNIWNFAEKHPFLFYSCVSSLAGATVKIVRTLKGEPKPVSVTMSDAVVEEAKRAIKDACKTHSPSKEWTDACTSKTEEPKADEEIIPVEAGQHYVAYELHGIGEHATTDDILHEFEGYIDLWSDLPMSEVKAFTSQASEISPVDFEWGWTKNEWENEYTLYGNVLILPPPHKL